MAKHIVTNVADGPRVLNTTPAMVLQPGESTAEAVEISDAELASAKAIGWFEFGAKAAKEAAKEAEQDPLDHDGDGRKGGHVANKKS